MDSSKLLSPLTPSTTVTLSPSQTDYFKTEYDGVGPCSELPNPTRQWRRWRAIGLLGATVLCSGFIVALTSLGFLLFLWTGDLSSEGKGSTSLWRWIMLNGHATPAITFTTLILRAAVGAQVGLCTSLVASLLLERSAVPLSQVASYSILRSVHASPSDLVSLLWREPSRRRLASIPTVLFMIMAFAFAAMQFSSTILVLDLGDTTLIGYSITQNLNLGPEKGRSVENIFAKNLTSDTKAVMLASNVLFSSEYDYSSRPQVFASFGEIGPLASLPDRQGLSDTGLTQRALLPFSNSTERTALREYNGYTTVFDSRVTCVPPKMTATYRVKNALVGTLDMDAIHAAYGLPYVTQNCTADGVSDSVKKNCTAPSFTCSTRINYGHEYDNATTFACLLDLPFNLNQSSYDQPFHNMRILEPAHQSYLVFNISGDPNQWGRFISYADPYHTNHSITLGDSISHDEWVTYHLEGDTTISASLCFMSYTFDFSEVDLLAVTNTKEPSITWNDEDRSWNVSEVRKQLGVSPVSLSPAERGIMEMKRLHADSVSSEPLYCLDLQGLVSIAPSIHPASNISIPFCPSCSMIEDNSTLTKDTGWKQLKPMHPHYIAIFEETLASTSRPALALHAILNVLAQNSYYDILSFANNATEVTTTSAIRANVPMGSRGLAIVSAIALLDLLCILGITVLFLTRSRFSLQGNFWQALSQLLSQETYPILDQASDLTDNEVTKLLDQYGEGRTQVSISRSIETGRVEVVRRRQAL